MASPIIPSSGLGSGLDIGSIVKVLVSGDTSAKQAQIKRQTSNNSAMISGIGSLRSALTAFQDAMKKLNDKNAPSFNAFAATSGNESVVKVKSNNTAVSGNYDIVVNKLATSSKVASQQFSNGANSAINAGDMTITQGGNSYKVTIGSGATLQTVRDQINKEMASNGISANIINESGGSRLVLTSTKTGAGNDISVGGIPDLTIDGTKQMSGTGGGFINALAQDADLTVDGLKITSATNTIDKAISGMSLELTGVSAKAADGTGTSTRLTVAQDNDGLKKSIQGFVDAYNTLQKAVTSLTATSKQTQDGKEVTVLGPLTNDPTTRSLLSDMRGVLSQAVSGGQLNSLSQLGINTSKDGTLEFNSIKFTAAMDDKKLGGEVQNLFTSDNGIFALMNKAIDPYNATDGSLATRKSNLDKVAKNLSDQQAALDRRTDSLTESLTRKFVALDTALGKMKAQANQITSIFDALNAQKKNG